MANDAADVLAIFGISGDLAKKMTFRALYRLEATGKLGGPLVRVAHDDGDRENAAGTGPTTGTTRSCASTRAKRSAPASATPTRTSSNDWPSASPTFRAITPMPR